MTCRERLNAIAAGLLAATPLLLPGAALTQFVPAETGYLRGMPIRAKKFVQKHSAEWP